MTHHIDYLRNNIEINKNIKGENMFKMYFHFISKKFPCSFLLFTSHCVCENAESGLFVKKVALACTGCISIVSVFTCVYVEQGNGEEN